MNHTGPDTSLTFNVNAFKANVQTVNTLPTAVKLILRKNPWERTTADLAYVFSFIDKAGPLNIIYTNKEMTEPQCQYNKQITDFIVKMLGNTQFNDFNFEDIMYLLKQPLTQNFLFYFKYTYTHTDVR